MPGAVCVRHRDRTAGEETSGVGYPANGIEERERYGKGRIRCGKGRRHGGYRCGGGIWKISGQRPGQPGRDRGSGRDRDRRRSIQGRRDPDSVYRKALQGKSVLCKPENRI